MLVQGLPHLKDKAELWVERGMRDEAEAQCARLRAEGFDAALLVVEDEDVAAAISRACDEVGASLVVVAASPHGFWGRLLNGSVTEDLLDNDARSLLVVRP